MSKGYYRVLGVPRSASDKEVRQAYRRLARLHHPDVNRGDKTSEARFKEANEAYQVLSDPQKRSQYDLLGENWQRNGHVAPTTAPPFSWHDLREDGGDTDPGGGSFEVLFDRLFRSWRETATPFEAQYSLEITLEEAYGGTTRLLDVRNGGTPQQLQVNIPAGVENGARLKVSQGNGKGSDLYVPVKIRPHSRFTRQGDDLETQVPLPLVVAVLGGELQMETLAGKVALRIPPETQNGQMFRLYGQGMPHCGRPSYGDLLVKVVVTLPTRLSEREKALFQELHKLRS